MRANLPAPQTKKARSRSSAPHRRQPRGSVSPRNIGRYLCTANCSTATCWLNGELGGWLRRTTRSGVAEMQSPAPLPGRGRGVGANNLCRKRTSGGHFLAGLQPAVIPGAAPGGGQFRCSPKRCTILKQPLMRLPREPAEQADRYASVPSRETAGRRKSAAESEAWQRFSTLARRLQLPLRCKQPNCRR